MGISFAIRGHDPNRSAIQTIDGCRDSIKGSGATLLNEEAAFINFVLPRYTKGPHQPFGPGLMEPSFFFQALDRHETRC
jgi:hypothetical protein